MFIDHCKNRCYHFLICKLWYYHTLSCRALQFLLCQWDETWEQTHEREESTGTVTPGIKMRILFSGSIKKRGTRKEENESKVGGGRGGGAGYFVWGRFYISICTSGTFNSIHFKNTELIPEGKLKKTCHFSSFMKKKILKTG